MSETEPFEELLESWESRRDPHAKGTWNAGYRTALETCIEELEEKLSEASERE